ncbi:MAG: hypothetical protein MJ060_00915 [Clostridia bacterium]|nr:hypothetical protein [Clostridia bacterium]
MKKIILTACAFVLCVACGFGLTACSTEEVKENTSAVIETSTGMIPVEYSQGLATNLLQEALTNLRNVSYSFTLEHRDLVAGALQNVNNPGSQTKITFINDYGNTRLCLEYNQGVKQVVRALKDADEDARYYVIDTKTRKYSDPGADIGTIGFAPDPFLKNITDGMCYNGISYINGCRDSGEEKGYFQFQIKDGLIRSCMVTYRNVDTMLPSGQTMVSFSYENIKRPVNLPDTVAALESMGYQLEAWSI